LGSRDASPFAVLRQQIGGRFVHCAHLRALPEIALSAWPTVLRFRKAVSRYPGTAVSVRHFSPAARAAFFVPNERIFRRISSRRGQRAQTDPFTVATLAFPQFSRSRVRPNGPSDGIWRCILRLAKT